MLGIKPTAVRREGTPVKSTLDKEKKMTLEIMEETPVVETLVDGAYCKWVLDAYYNGIGFTVEWYWDRAVVSRAGIDGVCEVYIGDWSEELWKVEETVGRYAVMHNVVNAIDAKLLDYGMPLPNFRWRPHQIGEGYRLYRKMVDLGWAIVMHMPRTGKTGTVLYALEMFDTMKVLIVTTKNGVKGIGKELGGWLGFIELAQSSGWLKRHTYHVSTPHRVGKLFDTAGTWDMVVVDEAHKIYSDPKPTVSKLWTALRYVISDARVMFVTATPHAQSINQLYWMLGLSSYSPFYAMGLMKFEDYFSLYGIPYTVIVGSGMAVPRWDKGKVDEVYSVVRDGVLSLTQEEVGFDREFLPVDIPCYVDLDNSTWDMINGYVRDEYINIDGVRVHTMNASDVPMRVHQMEGSTLKYVDIFSITDEATGIRRRDIKPQVFNWFLGGMEKVRYIKERWGDRSDMVIMYHYVNEGKLLRREFKNAKVFQGITHSEAIDLWMYDIMIVYSMNYSVATYIQRRDRQVHLTKRVSPIEVYYLLCKGLVSEEVYQAVVERGEDLTFSKYGKLS